MAPTGESAAAVLKPAVESISAAPGVFRNIVSKAVLELDPALNGQLDLVPAAARADALTAVELLPGDIKVMTVNVHMFTPGGVPLDPANETLDGIRNVAARIRAEDPDVVIVQELRRRPANEGRPGIPEQPSVFAHMIGATDMVATPAVASMPNQHEGYGVAMFALKGAKFGTAINARLSNIEEGVELRSAAVADLRLPNGERRTVIGTHLANDDHHRPVVEGETGPTPDQRTRDLQLGDIAGLVHEVNETGAVTYRSVVDGSTQHARGFTPHGVIVAGDFNQTRAETDRIFGPQGLQNANDILRLSGRAGAPTLANTTDGQSTAWYDGIEGPRHQVDSVYGDQWTHVVDSRIVAADRLPGGVESTDHQFPVVVVRRADPGPNSGDGSRTHRSAQTGLFNMALPSLLRAHSGDRR